MDTAATRSLVTSFLEARAANDAAGLDALLADDAAWYPPQSVLRTVEGRENVVKALTGGAIGKFLDVSTVQRNVHKLIVEGDTAVALQRLTATTVNGEAYENEYCWVYTCRDGKIARLDEFVDSFKAAKLFGLVKS